MNTLLLSLMCCCVGYVGLCRLLVHRHIYFLQLHTQCVHQQARTSWLLIVCVYFMKATPSRLRLMLVIKRDRLLALF